MAKVDLGGWLEHWTRVGRWHERLHEICERGVPPGVNPARAIDDVLAFFVFCYHLRDAVVREGWRTEKQIDAYIKTDAALALCRDLTTAFKHLEVRSPYVKTQSISTASLPVVVVSGVKLPCEPQPGVHWVVRTDAGDKDIFELADECVEAWRSFLLTL